jgi:hypothetical protein
LLVPTKDVEIRQGDLVIKASATLNERERAFFDRYQKHLSWGGGAFEELWQMQVRWSQLPQVMQGTLRNTGFIVDIATRFSEPSDELCLKRYLLSRQSTYRNACVLMPMLELINDSDKAAGFIHGHGIAVEGMFDGEVLVNYNPDDCWGRALFHGFCDPTDHALSLAFRYQSGESRIEIHHEYNRLEQYHGVGLPIVRIEQDGTVDFSCLMLGHVKHPRLPRAVFQHVTKNTPIKRPDELFDLIQHYNRMQFLEILRVLEGAATPLMTMLREAAYQQLATLSNYWGTGPLGAGGPRRPD